jgi:hypothetical protein
LRRWNVLQHQIDSCGGSDDLPNNVGVYLT